MPDSSLRRFTASDAMILVAATAVGFGVIRLWTGPNISEGLDRMPTATLVIAQILASVALYWAPAVLLLRYRRPRPPWRRLRGDPGHLACLAVVLAALNHFMLAGYTLILPGRSKATELLNILIGMTSIHFIAPAVALTWIILAVIGRWRRATDWVDRLGRFVGLTWLVLYAQLQVRIYWSAAS